MNMIAVMLTTGSIDTTAPPAVGPTFSIALLVGVLCAGLAILFLRFVMKNSMHFLTPGLDGGRLGESYEWRPTPVVGQHRWVEEGERVWQEEHFAKKYISIESQPPSIQ